MTLVIMITRGLPDVYVCPLLVWRPLDPDTAALDTAPWRKTNYIEINYIKITRQYLDICGDSDCIKFRIKHYILYYIKHEPDIT